MTSGGFQRATGLATYVGAAAAVAGAFFAYKGYETASQAVESENNSFFLERQMSICGDVLSAVDSWYDVVRVRYDNALTINEYRARGEIDVSRDERFRPAAPDSTRLLVGAAAVFENAEPFIKLQEKMDAIEVAVDNVFNATPERAEGSLNDKSQALLEDFVALDEEFKRSFGDVSDVCLNLRLGTGSEQ